MGSTTFHPRSLEGAKQTFDAIGAKVVPGLLKI